MVADSRLRRVGPCGKPGSLLTPRRVVWHDYPRGSSAPKNSNESIDSANASPGPRMVSSRVDAHGVGRRLDRSRAAG